MFFFLLPIIYIKIIHICPPGELLSVLCFVDHCLSFSPFSPGYCFVFLFWFMASDYLFKYKLSFVAFYNGQHCYLKSSCVLILSATCFDVYNYMLSYLLWFTPKSVVQFVIAVIWFVGRLIYFIYVFLYFFAAQNELHFR
jgi:hypothetical protein